MKFSGTYKKPVNPVLESRALAKEHKKKLIREYNQRAPYVLLLNLEGRKSPYPFGQFRKAATAFEAGIRTLGDVKHLPIGKRCLGFTVQNINTGKLVGPDGEPL